MTRFSTESDPSLSRRAVLTWPLEGTRQKTPRARASRRGGQNRALRELVPRRWAQRLTVMVIPDQYRGITRIVFLIYLQFCYRRFSTRRIPGKPRLRIAKLIGFRTAISETNFNVSPFPSVFIYMPLSNTSKTYGTVPFEIFFVFEFEFEVNCWTLWIQSDLNWIHDKPTRFGRSIVRVLVRS